jgi:hypothetical protein
LDSIKVIGNRTSEIKVKMTCARDTAKIEIKTKRRIEMTYDTTIKGIRIKELK